MRIMLIVLAWAAVAGAQSPDRPKFEVASVKPNNSGDTKMGFAVRPGGRFVAINVPVRELIRTAYMLQVFQLGDAPAWVSSERFDITAVSDRELNAPTWEPGVAFGPLQLMMQSLLADRFNLRARHEERQGQVYALVRDENATEKLTPVTPCGTDCRMPQFGPGALSARGSLVKLAAALSQVTGRLVIDATGLVGDFQVELRWAPEPSSNGVFQQAATDAPSIFTALREQLGLRLESRRGSVDTLIIDSIDRPTAD
jgi:uncharacterized protein (TIGR03435 family)